MTTWGTRTRRQESRLIQRVKLSDHRGNTANEPTFFATCKPRKHLFKVHNCKDEGHLAEKRYGQRQLPFDLNLYDVLNKDYLKLHTLKAVRIHEKQSLYEPDECIRAIISYKQDATPSFAPRDLVLGWPLNVTLPNVAHCTAYSLRVSVLGQGMEQR